MIIASSRPFIFVDDRFRGKACLCIPIHGYPWVVFEHSSRNLFVVVSVFSLISTDAHQHVAGTRAAGAAALAVLGRKAPPTLPHIFNHLCAAGKHTFGIASPIVMLRR